MWALSQKILAWLVLWAAGGSLFVYLVRRGTNYVDRFLVTAFFFSVMSLLVAIPFRHLLWHQVTQLGWRHVLLLTAAVALQWGIHATARRLLPRPAAFIRAHPHIYFLRLDYRYLVSKPCEILFQQTLLASLVLVLADAGLGTAMILSICIPLFGAAHLPLLKLVGRFFGWFYIASAALAATVFPILILSLEDGVFYTYLAHWFFYSISGVSFWLFLSRRPITEVRSR